MYPQGGLLDSQRKTEQETFMRYLGSLFIGADQPGWESDSSSVKPEGGMVVQYLMGSPSVSPSEEGLRDVLVT